MVSHSSETVRPQQRTGQNKNCGRLEGDFGKTIKLVSAFSVNGTFNSFLAPLQKRYDICKLLWYRGIHYFKHSKERVLTQKFVQIPRLF
ncbi:hypothetical protein AC249_AIPGENE10646 [Exaiptasia diaphana]|nr:hypothetical protein AC249_AIPGENE10646 [Exaiptasia diaphana]